MDISSFTEADLARLALSVRLRDLSEAFRVAVAAEDGEVAGEPKLAARLWSLLATEVPKLEQDIVAQVRSTGGSWADVAALAAPDGDRPAGPDQRLSEDEARRRWAGTEVSRIADPVGAAAALDDWYIRHAQLEPLARVRDAFSRLLSGHPSQELECLICVKYQGGALPAYGGYPTPPGGHLVDDGIWRVGHGPTPYWPAGTLLIESHRHFLDFADMTEAEATSIGPLIRRFVGPLKQAMDAPRIHVFSCMEGAAHFHLWLVPRVGDVPSGRSFIGNPGYSSVPEAEQAIERLRAALAGQDR